MMQNTSTKRILIYGSGLSVRFLSYIKSLTGKENPRICFLPTANADNVNSINQWYEHCQLQGIHGFAQRMFISSYEQHQSFEEVLLTMDAIVVGGGNTLNMLAIWRAHGVDEILRTAWNKGILLCGGSAGSLCWFEEGTTDSRPKVVTKIECLGFLKGSHCPHYDSEATRRPLYHSYILQKELKPGYACDDRAGILFHDNEPYQVISLNDESNAYYVSVENSKIKEVKLKKEVLR